MITLRCRISIDNTLNRNIINFKILTLISLIFILNSCEALKFKKVDAREFPPDPEKRVEKNINNINIVSIFLFIIFN